MTKLLETKKGKIISVSIDMLKDIGLEGLTMRKLATGAGISLGNLQYHFKDKSALLVGMAEYYFEFCHERIGIALKEKIEGSDREVVSYFVSSFLNDVHQLTDMCRMFKEIWTISTRNTDIAGLLENYYLRLQKELSDLFLKINSDFQQTMRASSMLITFIEGYSVTHKAVPYSVEEVSETWTDILLQMMISK